MGKKQVRVIIQGKVQGVFYRASTRRTADALGITGWVKNMPDQTVHALFQGNPDTLHQMIQWCKKGPAGSRVDRVLCEDQEVTTEYENFKILY